MTKYLNPVMDFINTLCNFIVLNLLFLITCLPVFTIGTALSSLYYVMIKEARGEYGYLVRTYLREFKKNLKVGTGAFAILFISGALLLFGLSFWGSYGTMFSAVLTGILILAALAWVLIFTYTFPVIGRFETDARMALKNSWALALTNVRATLSLILIDICVICLCLFAAPMKLLMVLFGFAFIAYCQSFIFNKVFAPYEETEDASMAHETMTDKQREMMSGTSQY